MQSRVLLFILCSWLASCSCSGKKGDDGGGGTPPPNPPVGNPDVAAWMTTGDQTALLQKQTVVLSFGTTANAFPLLM